DQFTAKGEVILFDGFLKVYLEDTDEENAENGEEGILPTVKKGLSLKMESITATERFTRPPSRYTEASLVKKLEELGIGRPSTYAPTISTIQKRGYVHKEERQGKEREYKVITLHKNGKLAKEVKTEITGGDKGKLFPTDIAAVVTDFLNKHFPEIMDYQFTARIEEELDEIALGKLEYEEMLKEFYFPFHKKVKVTIDVERPDTERVLGTDPATGLTVSVRLARFGPVAQKTDPKNSGAKPIYARLRKDQKLETITLEEALGLFKLPRVLGEYEGKEVIAAISSFGPYIKHDGKFISIKKQYDPFTITLVEAVHVIDSKRVSDSEKYIKVFDEDPSYQILNGRWGPYLKAGKRNIKLPKDREPTSFTFEECVALANNTEETKGKKKAGKKK
ncbi:DNA topoisomerase, partial [Ignavibacterium sp.]|uniref:DNA topoisomerase n=1 Tax=Ignavibacterium sp. TaxID=2651167 RepID=UPI00307EF51F